MNKTDAAGLVAALSSVRQTLETLYSYDGEVCNLATDALSALGTADNLIESLSRPPLGDVDELCGKDARELLAAEIKVDPTWQDAYRDRETGELPSDEEWLVRASGMLASIRAIEKALSDRTALMARVAEAEKAMIEVAEMPYPGAPDIEMRKIARQFLSSKGSGA
jgi:hypothetical protein